MTHILVDLTHEGQRPPQKKHINIYIYTHISNFIYLLPQ